jgi:hypothetical protein
MGARMRSPKLACVCAALLLGCAGAPQSAPPGPSLSAAGASDPQSRKDPRIYTQMWHGQRYPWDERPFKCLAPGAPQIGLCKPLDNWPTPDRTIHYISNLYFNESFPLLEHYLSELAASKKRFADGTYAEEAIFRAFSQIMSGPTAQQSGAQLDAEWRKAVPGSQFVALAEYERLYTMAWDARGRGYADTVSPESWELFAIRLKDAEQALVNAPGPLKDTPEWHMAMLAISLEPGHERDRAQHVFERAVERWPTYAMFYQLMLDRMVPKWGGSWEQVETFIESATGLQPASEGKSLYARLYVYLIPERSDVDSKFDWSVMKSSFDDLLARFPAAKYKNLYASYACRARDKAAFNRAMGEMPNDQLIKVWWLNGASYEACMRWAGT